NLGGGQFELFQNLGGLYGPASWGDFDNDGRLDIISTGDDFSGVSRAKVFRNVGGSFQPVLTYSNLSANGALTLPGLGSAWMDINEDGNLDLMLRQFDPLVWGGWKDFLLVGNGQGSFSNAVVPWSGSILGWADFDNDGHPDVVENTGPVG